MVNKTTYYSDILYGMLLQVAEKEYPKDKEAVNKVIQDSVKARVQSLAEKHHIKMPKKLQRKTD
jgi:uncharacterized protein (DUF2236 family)